MADWVRNSQIGARRGGDFAGLSSESERELIADCDGWIVGSFFSLASNGAKVCRKKLLGQP
jgi:hypothetical protein